MTEAARAGVYEHRQLVLSQTERLCRTRIGDALDDLYFDEVISRAKASELASSTILRAL